MNCPYCKRYFSKKSVAVEHIEKIHLTELTKNNIDASQALYLGTHGTLHGKCMCGCGKDTEWNYKTGKPYKVSNDPKCRERLNDAAKKNHLKVYGVTTLLNDMEHQKEMQENRPTAGKYTFNDGAQAPYLSKLELNFLKFCDTILEFSGNMVQLAPESFIYHDDKDDRDRQYIPDYYLPDYNLLIEIKDGGKNPNTNPAFIAETKYKVKLKDDVMRKQDKYNYIKIVDNNYGPFMETLFKIVEQSRDDKLTNKNAIIVITENAKADYIEPEEVIVSPNLYAVVTKVPGTKMVTSLSLSDSYGMSNLCCGGRAISHTASIYNESDVEVYRYIGNSEKAIAVNKYCQATTAFGLGLDELAFGIDTLSNCGIKFHFNESITNNNYHMSEFIKIHDFKYTTESGE